MEAKENVPAEDVSAEEIWFERALTQNKIEILRRENEYPDNQPGAVNYIPGIVEENNELIRVYESVSDEELKKLVLWKKANKKANEKNREDVEKIYAAEAKSKSTPEPGEMFSFNDLHPLVTVSNKTTRNFTVVQPFGEPAKIVRDMAGLPTIADGLETIKGIKAAGYDILACPGRVVVFNEKEFYDFNDSLRLRPDDLFFVHFKEFIKSGFKLTKEMKSFASREKWIGSENWKRELAALEETTCENFQERLARNPGKSAVVAAQMALVNMRSDEEKRFNEIVRSQGLKGPDELAAWLEDVRSGRKKFEMKAGPEKKRNSPEFGPGM